MRSGRAVRNRLGLVSLSLAGLVTIDCSRADAVLVTSCYDSAMCGPGTGACTIAGSVEAEPGSLLDCGQRNLTIGATGNLKVTGGEMYLRAGNLTVNGPGGTISGVEGSDDSTATLDIDLSGTLSLSGKIRANGQRGGGNIRVSADGNILIPESGTDGIEADGTGNGADGGEIVLKALGTISIYDPVHAAGNAATNSDSCGGTVEIEAVGDVVTGTDGHISAEGVTGGGGRVSISSTGGDVTIDEHVDVEGRSAYGDGGQIEISAFDRLEISEQITARGGANANGGEAYGGTIDLSAGCGGLTISVPVLASGGQLGSANDGGAITVESRGAVTLAAGATLDARALASSGQGGEVRITAGQTLTLSNTSLLDARGGGTSPGKAGFVKLEGCSVQVASGATIDVSGNRGGTITVSGEKSPPAEGTQPLIVSTGALLKADGADSAKAGVINLAPTVLKKGKCQVGGLSCFLDSECVNGCESSDCIYANPDTDGVGTQFNVTPRKLSPTGAAICDAVCVP